jgi:hypothetical protein
MPRSYVVGSEQNDASAAGSFYAEFIAGLHSCLPEHRDGDGRLILGAESCASGSSNVLYRYHESKGNSVDGKGQARSALA